MEKTPWDPVEAAADLRLRFVAAHARLRQAQIILGYRDVIFPRTLDATLDDAEEEIRAALEALDAVPGAVARVESAGVVERRVVDWPDGWRRRDRRETVALVALGLGAGGVGEALGVRESAVRSRLSVAFRDLGVRNQPALVDRGWRDGVLGSVEVAAFQQPYRGMRRVGWGRVQGVPPRRRQVLRGLAAGLEAREIAAELGVAAGTVKEHLRLLRVDLGVGAGSSAGVVNRAWEIGWLG